MSATGTTVIAVTVGDPGGVGPEIVSRFFASHRPRRSVGVVIGAAWVLEPWGKRFRWGMEVLATREDISRARGADRGTVLVLDTGCEAKFTTGDHSAGGGEHAGIAVEEACRLAGSGLVDAVVTAPLSKRSLNLAGYRYPGHTEMLRELLRAQSCEMMMVYKRLRVVPMTRHLPLSRVVSELTVERVERCIKTVDGSLRELFGIEHPKIAFAAVNPHAGDGGVLGEEEATIVAPALERARKDGIEVEGPVPGDVVFQSVFEDAYDAYIASYHDQALIPFKMIARGRGVNVTVGLPVVRTSVDHGTAFDIAGKGEASIESLKEAYVLAEKLAPKTKHRAGRS